MDALAASTRRHAAHASSIATVCSTWSAIVLLLGYCAVATSAAHADDTTLVIDVKTDLKKLFECSRQRPVGSFNEYYVVCDLKSSVAQPLRRVRLQGVAIHGSDLVADASYVHVEVSVKLNASLAANTTIEFERSTIHTTAVTLEASHVVVDATSSINTTASGLKFGPGYNSWFNMGSSYGGLGGAAFGGGIVHRKCEDLPALNFFRAIGSVDGDSGNFQGYGSGGGTDETRGGGRIDIRATQQFLFNGSLFANGGSAEKDSSESAGSGGTVLVNAGHIGGSGSIEANGGEPSVYLEASDVGGGGGGGGGRVALRYTKLDELNATQLQAYGGGVVDAPGTNVSSKLQWCQLGGDGSILKVQVTSKGDGVGEDATSLVGNLVIKGRRVEHGVPAKLVPIYGCSPLFFETSRGDRFVPEYVAQLFVMGGASVCTSYFVLEPNVSTTNSSIVIESGSSIHTLDRNRTVTLAATHVSLQSFVGPVSQSVHDTFTLSLSGGEIALANAQLLIDRLLMDAASTIIIDKYSVIKFSRLISLTAVGDVQVLGILEPGVEEFDFNGESDEPVVSVVANQSVVFTPQSAQVGTLRLELHAGEDATIDMPFETPFLSLFADATNLVVPRVTGGALRECKAIESLASVTTCSTPWKVGPLAAATSPYLLNFRAKETFTLGNVSGGSILMCSEGVLSVEGHVTANALGCSANSGPGTSAIASGASGGAGHGGKGGNVEPGNTGGGKAYDFPPSEFWPYKPSDLSEDKTAWPVWPGSGAASGDGSGGIAGGNGGGVVYVGARQLSFSNPSAVISSCGGVGSKSGGGGAGGAIMLSIGQILGSGRVDVSGGDSLATTVFTTVDRNPSSVWELSAAAENAKPGGGGGGGGIIRTFFHGDEPGTPGNGDDFIQHGGKLTVNGGKGLGGEDGGAGIVSAMNCTAGRGGGLCLECEPGSFSPLNEPKCLPCEPGSFSDKKGLENCSKCAAGSFNPDFGKKVCESCAPGSFASAIGSKACAPCAPGSFADKAGESSCQLCPTGSISVSAGTTKCTLCGIGETTAKPGALHCESCHNKPEHSTFNVPGKCTYACEKGRTGLDCLTPFERFVKPIGGPLGFAILVLGLLLTVFGSWGFITYRGNSDQKFQKRFAEYKAQTQRDQLSLTNLTKNLTPRLTDQDLVGHVTRLYFSGANHLFSSWVLDPFGMPMELKDLVRDEDAFASFATSCNELVAWPQNGVGWECWAHRVLMVLAPPLGTLFLRQRQLYRVERLAKHVTQYTGGFVRELGFRRHGAQLKVGFSPDFSLAYFDVIAPSPAFASAPTALLTRSRLQDRDAPHSITTSFIIAAAGSGSFFRPYNIDTNDVLVRAVPARLELLHHQFWIDFVAEMNQRLRLLEQPTSSVTRLERAAASVTDILAFVSTFNEQRKKSADGIRVRFGTLESTSQFTPLKDSDISSRLESYTIEQFKFALQVTRRPTTGHDAASPDASALQIHLDETASTASYEPMPATSLAEMDDPRPIEFRYSSIRMEALFDRPRQHSEGDELLEPLYPTKLRRQTSRDASLSELLLCSPRSASFYWFSLVFKPVAPVFRLRNLRPRVLAALPLTMLVLLLADFVVVFWILMEFYCVQVEDPTAHDSGCSHVAFVSVLSVLPLALAAVPILGLVFLARKSVFYGKLFAVWTLGSLVNLLVAFVCGLAYFNYVRETVLLVAGAGLLIKLLEKEVALQCIAQYTVERPLKGWRGLHTTKDWYDAAYTPLIHHEQ